MMFYNKVIDLVGWKSSLIYKESYKESTTAFQRYIAEETFLAGKISPDEIYFSGEYPFIQIKKLERIESSKIRELHSKIWNEGRSPFLAIFTPTEMRLYNCYEPPVLNEDQVENKLQLDKFQDIEADLSRIIELLHQSKIDSGKIWDEKYGTRLNVNSRVDKKLVTNLRVTRAKLYNEGKDLPLPVVHSLLGRALFIFYLEDRNILTVDAFPKKPRGVNKFSDLLGFREETYELFEKLEEKFNGDLFPVSSLEKKLVKLKHLEKVQHCFHDLDVSTGQMSLDWKMFQFDFIPIELLSSIYEEFMSEEERQSNGQIKIKENGAYYTKPMLVEFMLNEVLPWPDENNKRYDLKILDPACGSGIFLVESYRRLIARWKYSKNRKKIDENSLTDILLNSLFGIDKDTEAIKVAAFSLYLTFLNYLEPIEIKNDYIEKKRKKLPPLIRWSNIDELKERNNKQVGNNLFQFNTFENSEILNNKFDIIVGNPPWRKDKPEKIVASYIAKEALPAQIVCAYLNLMPNLLSEDGIIALVTAAKIFFNTGDIYESFRQKLFKDFDVDTVINLSVVREIMFTNARAPGAVIVYRKKSIKEEPYIVYCIPKNVKTIDSKQSLIIDSTEVKYLPKKEIIKNNSKLFKIAMWGSMRDYFLLSQVNQIKSIGEIFKNSNKGIGIHAKGDEDKTLSSKIRNYKLLSQTKLQKYYTPNSGLNELGSQYTRFRKINECIFEPPIILLKRGSTNMDFVFSYVDYRCVYEGRIYGISIQDKNIIYIKALVALLNSTFAKYYLFLTSSTWGVDKTSDILHNEILAIPAVTENMNEKSLKEIALKVDEILNLFMNKEEETLRIQKEIDKIIYREFQITSREQQCIEDILNNSVVLHERYKNNLSTIAVDSQTVNSNYSKVLSETLYNTLKHSNSNLWIEVLNTGRRELLHTVIIHFSDEHVPGSYITSTIDIQDFGKIIKEINLYMLKQHSESVYFRRVVKYYKKDKIYLIKPNEKRFWTTAEALNDSDGILADLLNAKKIVT